MKQKFIKAKDLAKKLGYKEIVIGKYGVFVSGKVRPLTKKDLLQASRNWAKASAHRRK
jgi:hypothetical protein